MHAGAGLCSAADCMWSCRVEELSVHFALWLREGYRFVNVACMRNCITLAWSNMLVVLCCIKLLAGMLNWTVICTTAQGCHFNDVWTENYL